MIDSEELEDVPQTDVQMRTGTIDVNGNIQTAVGSTDAKEYVYNHAIDLTDKVIWPLADPLSMGYNSVINWGFAVIAMVDYFLKKHGQD